MTETTEKSARLHNLDWLQMVAVLGVFVFPLALVIYALLPIFPGDDGWAVFTFILLFFVFRYVLIDDARFSSAIRRDWALQLTITRMCEVSL